MNETDKSRAATIERTLRAVLDTMVRCDNSHDKSHPWISGMEAGPLKERIEAALNMPFKPPVEPEYCERRIIPDPFGGHRIGLYGE